jgi:hypothetical protein
MYTSWFAVVIISVYTAQNTIHLRFDFSILIQYVLDTISTEAVDSVASMMVTTLCDVKNYSRDAFMNYESVLTEEVHMYLVYQVPL